MTMLTKSLLLVLIINGMLFMTQAAMLDVNPDLTDSTFKCKGTILESFEVEGCSGSTYTLDSNISTKLPSNPDVSTDTGNFFTDAFKTAKAWVADTLGVSYIYQILKAPYALLRMMGLPDAFTFVVGSIWYGLTLFLVVAFLLGRDL